MIMYSAMNDSSFIVSLSQYFRKSDKGRGKQTTILAA